MDAWSSDKASGTASYRRSIVFRERFQERVFDASTDEILSNSCLIVLRERYENPAWGYKPQRDDFTEEEKEFVEYFQRERYFLPSLLQKMGDRILRQIDTRVDITSDPDWNWYSSVQNLLALPSEKAIDYRIPYKGRLIPTSYYLLTQRRSYPFEGFVILDKAVDTR